MTESSSNQGRGSHLDANSNPEDQIPSAITKADQMAWERPELRPTFTPDGKREKWAHPCPPWCDQDGDHHDVLRLIDGARGHMGTPILIRTDGGRGYYDDVAGVEGIRNPHLEVRLGAASRALEPRIQITRVWGEDGERRSNTIPAMYFDEVRELITVLQHLMKVGQES
ncbi:hypothetical protein [Nocardioides nitrophenolicus]|uniref:hypothetical protein n=1 Tax=Nocardioides nitrophenolicus TaxID=60489 RepID=UPI000B2260EF|nr:hypothetical protein [Nocardioides nitrophenolicus]MBM7518249.1 hypothetical protein [Nocardioides nitrophenolicus]